MKRRFLLISSALTALLLMVPNAGRADSIPQHGSVTIACQIQLPTFPAPLNTSAAPHKCGGGAIINAMTTVGKEDVVAGSGCAWNPVTDKKNFKNEDGTDDGTSSNCPAKATPTQEGGFNAYNIFYSEACQPGEVVPSVGSAIGDAWINVTTVANGGTITHHVLVFHFEYTRTANVWQAIITKASIQNIPWRLNGQTVAPTGSASGTAVGKFLIKATGGAGTCGSPTPTTVILTGTAVF